MERTFIVIVHYNSEGYINDCLRSIITANPAIPMDQIIIVDNLSTDSSLEECRNKYRKITYIYNTRNIGFAAAANIGARRALECGAEHVIFCNPDATASKTCLEELVRAAQKSPGIYSPYIAQQQTKKLWFAGGEVDFYRQRATHVMPTTQEHLGSAIYDTSYVSGCMMCVSAEVFAAIGLFDEQFFLYYEDVDFSLRAQKAGFATSIVSHARAEHAELSESLGDQKIYFLVLAGLQFFAKNTPTVLRPWYTLYTAMRRAVNIIKLLLRKPHAQAVHYAFQDYAKAKRNPHFIPHRTV